MIESRPGLVVFISELRRSIRALFIAIVVVTGVVFFLTPQLLELVQAHLADKGSCALKPLKECSHPSRPCIATSENAFRSELFRWVKDIGMRFHHVRA